MKKRSSPIIVGVVLGIVLLTVAAVGFARSSSDSSGTSTPDIADVIEFSDPAAARVGPGIPLDEVIARLQARLEDVPDDDVSWATLGLAYIQQARVTVNPDFYPRAEGALDRSFEINDKDNFLGYAGRSALASARHDFTAARDYARRGIEINAYSALLYGALSDAEIQLGEYDEAFAHVQRMLDLSPDTTSLARASYTWELRGDIAQATQLMERALESAPTDSDRAFAQFFLGELAFDQGDPNQALRHYLAALASSPDDVAALAGRAKAEAALGQVETALDHYAEVVARAPEPSYVVAYGELLESVGRTDEAAEQYRVFEATQALFTANGVQPDSTLVLFTADHGDPAVALEEADAAVRAAPFVAVRDAYAWALHVNGRDADALEQVELALALGTRSALFHYHAGMIKRSLGDDAGAVEELTLALSINPHFHPLAAAIAERTLTELEAA